MQTCFRKRQASSMRHQSMSSFRVIKQIRSRPRINSKYLYKLSLSFHLVHNLTLQDLSQTFPLKWTLNSKYIENPCRSSGMMSIKAWTKGSQRQLLIVKQRIHRRWWRASEDRWAMKLVCSAASLVTACPIQTVHLTLWLSATTESSFLKTRFRSAWGNWSMMRTTTPTTLRQWVQSQRHC